MRGARAALRSGLRAHLQPLTLHLYRLTLQQGGLDDLDVQEKSAQGALATCRANGIDPKSADRIETILDMLDKATRPEDMDLPGFGFHQLKGNRSHQYAVEIRAQWRIVFEWEVDEEDYHGK